MTDNICKVFKEWYKMVKNVILKPFICINCGNKVKELYKTYSTSVIKIIKCENCHEVADKYIEFEPIIILVDLVLLSKGAYRHVLYNTDFKLHWKLSLVLLLLESFALWRQKLNNPLYSKADESFTEERGFYICCLENIIDNIVLSIMLQVMDIFLKLFIKEQHFTFGVNSIILLCKTITIANFSKFFLLPIMIWKDNTTEIWSTMHYILVMGYYLISFIHIYSDYISQHD